METGRNDICETRNRRPKGRAPTDCAAKAVCRRCFMDPRPSRPPWRSAASSCAARVSARRPPAHDAPQVELAELDGRQSWSRTSSARRSRGEIVHADFYEVDLNAPMRVSVPLRFVGKAPAWPRAEFCSRWCARSRSNACRSRFPKSIEVDVTALGIHDVIHVSTMKFPGNIKPILRYRLSGRHRAAADRRRGRRSPPRPEVAPVEGAAGAEGAAAAGGRRRSGRQGRRQGRRRKEAAAEEGGGKKG